MKDKCPTCGRDVPDDPLKWLLRHCKVQVACLCTRASKVSPAVREGRGKLGVDIRLERWSAAMTSLAKLIGDE
jgi:hypothetical protein